MIIYKFTPWLFTLLMASSAQVSIAQNSGEAFGACKDHLAGIYSGDFRAKLKKVRRRQGATVVTIRASIDGQRFRATCLISKTGEISYTNNLKATSKEAIAENVTH